MQILSHMDLVSNSIIEWSMLRETEDSTVSKIALILSRPAAALFGMVPIQLLRAHVSQCPWPPFS